ncbi:aminotransferase class I/II-fold pyridoxal phosphate-dependent enzyme [Gordonia amarae]|uniref:aminotransferase class I/II-fold pyridoxal phosphate-dependent enzyme n=1 Tax=Gordonia amarae TaxID=36821 RepID=UPI001AF4BFBB|nr:aminotransferase class I/II-fold pyridoxal phosphate-dependent enzyme [Gordonia amarae]QHN19270.1 aminotransferase class I/II-fold pyridoxal phosphate-dependent enzyme [Gordonia amarae]QHN23746.1 aminotransferase class I/II-fold pyridoxal phosphate-dependent enzyme [Gordonia amarae]
MNYHSMSADNLRDTQAELRKLYDELCALGLSLDITRGKPAPDQLDLSNGLLGLPGEDDYLDAAGTDTRNYGGIAGLKELREIFGELLGVDAANLIAFGNSSLTLMHDVTVAALLHGTPDSERPWAKEDTVKFLCPAPGYDRHFAITESFGIEMITVPMNPDGPDVAAITELVAADPSIKGLWVVPTYSNPTGVTFSADVTKALLAVPAAAADFRIYWDNAYAVHTLVEAPPVPHPVLEWAAEAGHPNRVYVLGSTSKITFAGAGVAFFGSSADNLAWFTKHLGISTIGPDKVNQLRHVRFFGDADGVRAHMAKHRELLAPKFALVLDILDDRLGDAKVADWSHPEGGYFINLDVLDGAAKRTIELAKNAGIALTAAGSTYPYKQDPRDHNIRLAPTHPGIDDLRTAMEGVATCVLLAATETLLTTHTD